MAAIDEGDSFTSAQASRESSPTAGVAISAMVSAVSASRLIRASGQSPDPDLDRFLFNLRSDTPQD